jgi:uncharacterized protein (TIGR03435 family)
LANNLEDTFFKLPIINETALTNEFAFEVYWNANGDSLPNLKQALEEQLGLELVPGTAPVKVLIIEKVK